MSSTQDHTPKVGGNSKLKLKAPPQRLPPLDPGCRSDELHSSAVPGGADVRAFYIRNVHRRESKEVNPDAVVPPPLISASPFVPVTLIRLLMRGKKDSALGVKYGYGDRITDMEGAMHTFVTPIVGRCEMIGDYKYQYGHGVVIFGSADNPNGDGKFRLTRSVALSASIQPDFETPKVMLRVSKLDVNEVIGKNLLGGRTDGDGPWENCSVQDKNDHPKRAKYDARLRAHMVYHLVPSHRLPARKEIGNPMSVNDTIKFLESIIQSSDDVKDKLVDSFMETLNDQVVSLELLYNTAVQQVINEFSALEAMIPQGYVYTYDPPSIFAREIGSPILNRLFLAAIKAVSNHNRFTNMRTFAINDYADPKLVDLARNALSAPIGDVDQGNTVQCVGKRHVFGGKDGLYVASDHEKGAMLVIHNNSDGFGQNIETEGSGGSLDGAIGANSSAAASLERTREDLLDFIF